MQIIRTSALGLILALAAGPALAYHCPLDMGKIDAALDNGTGLDEAQMSRVKALRAEGERLHKAGKHGDSVAALGEAMKILGLK